MRKVAVVADSTCCLPPEVVEKYDICVVPFQIVHEGKSYRDGVDITPNEVYRIMRKKENLPTTSTPSAGDFLNAYRQVGQKAESILCITVTSLQSKTFEAALAAKDIAKEEIPNTIIEVFDSRSVAGALGFIVREAARFASKGEGLAEVVEVARNMMGKVNFLAMLDTLYYLARLGRIARAASWAGNMLDMKPVLEHSPAVGETMPVARPRTRRRAIECMLQIMAERTGGSPVHVFVQHADDLKEAKKLAAEIESRFNCAELYLTEFAPVMGVHTGPGLLAISFYAD
ncbi:MAG: DegV family protein [Chloroflexi bacterium]|nr:DegV family protein [Chloroflexota bacterium]MBL7062219.1 DegV family protein [Dehalococcoidia bacterium]